MNKKVQIEKPNNKTSKKRTRREFEEDEGPVELKRKRK